MYKGKHALVAGASGFIGGNLVKRLVAEGCQVRASYYTHRPVEMIEGVEYIQADLRDLTNCEGTVANMDYVFMCAANTAGAAVMTTTPLAHITPNVVMNTHLLEAAYTNNVEKFLFISSGAAYPDAGAKPAQEDEMFDGDPFETYYAVAWMKRYMEILCRTYGEKIKKPMATAVVRPSNVYGPGDKFDFKTSHVTAAMMRRVIDRHAPIEVWGTGDDIRDLIYIDDFIDGLMKAFERPESFFVTNIASGVGHSVKQILRTAMEVDGYTDADVRFDSSKPSTIPVRLFDTTYAEKELKFKAQTPLTEGFAKTIKWYRQTYPDGYGED